MNSDSEIAHELETIASHAVRQKAFSSLKQAQQHQKQIKADLLTLFTQGERTLIKGLTCLAADDTGRVHSYVAGVCAKLSKHIDSSKKFNRIIESDIAGSKHALLLFSEVIEKFLNNGDAEQEQSVLMVMMVLFPFHPQPYLYLGTSVWRNEGIDAAAALYAEVLKVIPDPAIYYFAADCFYQKGDKKQAWKLLQSGLKAARGSPGVHDHVEQRITAFIQNFQTHACLN